MKEKEENEVGMRAKRLKERGNEIGKNKRNWEWTRKEQKQMRMNEKRTKWTGNEREKIKKKKW